MATGLSGDTAIAGLSGAALIVVNVYIPNGSEVGSDKYRYKLEWLARFSLRDSAGSR
ncbi:MAG: hypothetical protein ACREWE_09745 [Gammaproteobacteria bacterium]